MKFYCKELNKHFESRKEALQEMAKRIDEITAIKKATEKRSDPSPFSIIGKTESTKSLTPGGAIGYGDYVFPVINTTNYLDSHNDVHIPGLWKKSIKEQQGKVFLIINHDLSIGKVISQPKDVEPFTKNLEWKELGANFEGETEALIFKSKLTERSNPDGFNAYKYGDPVEHSIRMIYDKMFFCINPDEFNGDDVKEFNSNWNKYLPFIVNIEKAMKDGYFWAVTEARIFKEGSMVIAGSNDITPTLYDLEKSSEDTLDNEPPISTQKTEAEKLQNKMNYLLNL